jgi:hypothetical protein
LANIRNVLAAHRRGLPDDVDRRKFREDFRAWGAWEQHLAELEAKCDLFVWIDFVNAAIILVNQVRTVLPGSWFSIRGDSLRQYIPIRLG